MLSRKSLFVVGLILLTVGAGGYYHHARKQSQLQKLMHCGQSLYTLVHQLSFDNPEHMIPLDRVAFPRSSGPDAFSNTTEIFHYLITNQIINDADAIELSGQTPRPGDVFISAKNVWCISADMSWKDDPETPYFFTRNLVITSLATRVSESWRDDELTGGDYVVVITRGGAGKIVHRRDLDRLFNPSGVVHAVLRP
jgi:hypothetical protein